MFVSEIVNNSDKWQSHDCTCLGHHGRHDTDRIISISLIWPSQVRKAISRCDIAGIIAGVIVLNSTNVKTALNDLLLNSGQGHNLCILCWRQGHFPSSSSFHHEQDWQSLRGSFDQTHSGKQRPQSGRNEICVPELGHQVQIRCDFICLKNFGCKKFITLAAGVSDSAKY